MKNKLINLKKIKKGELTTQQIVMLVILIVSFIVILFFLFILNPKPKAEKEICRNSVVLNSKTAGISGSLDCRTNYVCISGGEDCESFNAKEKIEVDLNDPQKAKDGVMEAIAEKMAECWWMFGEGKVNFGATEDTSIKYALCSVIKFDSEIQNEISAITYSELYNYLAQEKISESETYLHYLYGLFNAQDFKSQDYFNLDTGNPIDTSKRYSIITGIDDNITPWPDKFLRVNIIATDEISNLKDGEFITKA